MVLDAFCDVMLTCVSCFCKPMDLSLVLVKLDLSMVDRTLETFNFRPYSY